MPPGETCFRRRIPVLLFDRHNGTGNAMDVAWFLNQRLDFIRQLYARSSAPFVERQAKIENEEKPIVVGWIGCWPRSVLHYATAVPHNGYAHSHKAQRRSDS